MIFYDKIITNHKQSAASACHQKTQPNSRMPVGLHTLLMYPNLTQLCRLFIDLPRMHAGLHLSQGMDLAGSNPAAALAQAQRYVSQIVVAVVILFYPHEHTIWLS